MRTLSGRNGLGGYLRPAPRSRPSGARLGGPKGRPVRRWARDEGLGVGKLVC